MVCHGSMVALGGYLLYTGYVKLSHKTLLKALPVFAVCVFLAVGMNEIAHDTGLTETFNMFYISPHCEPSLLVYSSVQEIIPFPFCLLVYFLAFSLASIIILLVPLIKNRRNLSKEKQ